MLMMRSSLRPRASPGSVCCSYAARDKRTSVSTSRVYLGCPRSKGKRPLRSDWATSIRRALRPRRHARSLCQRRHDRSPRRRSCDRGHRLERGRRRGHLCLPSSRYRARQQGSLPTNAEASSRPRAIFETICNDGGWNRGAVLVYIRAGLSTLQQARICPMPTQASSRCLLVKRQRSTGRTRMRCRTSTGRSIETSAIQRFSSRSIARRSASRVRGRGPAKAPFWRHVREAVDARGGGAPAPE